MIRDIELQKQNINQFYQNQKIAITDLYRANDCATSIEKNVSLLNQFLEQKEHIDPNNKAAVARNLNNIAIQTNIIKATQEAMADELYKLKKFGDIQCSISGKMVCLKKDIERLLSKAERLIKNN